MQKPDDGHYRPKHVVSLSEYISLNKLRCLTTLSSLSLVTHTTGMTHLKMAFVLKKWCSLAGSNSGHCLKGLHCLYIMWPSVKIVTKHKLTFSLFLDHMSRWNKFFSGIHAKVIWCINWDCCQRILLYRCHVIYIWRMYNNKTPWVIRIK